MHITDRAFQQTERWEYICMVFCVECGKSWVTMSCCVWELAFWVPLCNSRCHLKWAVDHLRCRLPEVWLSTLFVRQSLSACVCVCEQVSSRHGWVLTSDTPLSGKAGERWLTNSGLFVDNWDVAEREPGLHSCQLEAHRVIRYPVRADNKT